MLASHLQTEPADQDGRSDNWVCNGHVRSVLDKSELYLRKRSQIFIQIVARRLSSSKESGGGRVEAVEIATPRPG